MKTPSKLQPAVEPDWSAIRLRYEARDESVIDIAASIGWAGNRLMHHAKLAGWLMRNQKRPAATAPQKPDLKIEAKPEAKPITSTKEAINRLKLLVQQRISRLEQQVVTGDDNHGINAANLLARTLEKVLELEEQQAKQRKLLTAQTRRRDDTWREELAGRLARLASGGGFERGIEPDGSEGSASGLASVGA